MLQSITLTQFRNFPQAHFQFTEKIVGLAGLNGIGKTNLLDAIYYLCYTKSYFQSRDRNNVQHHQNGFRIKGIFSNPETLAETEVACVWKEGKKTVLCNRIPYTKVSEHIGKLSAVMIAPDDSEIVVGGGENRRKFFDSILSLKDEQYLRHLLQYQKTVQQKNAYLKMHKAQGVDYQLLDIYDETLAKSGAYIISKRADISAHFPELIRKYYQQVSSNNNEIPHITYEANTTASTIAQTYQQYRNKEIEARRTLLGPHLDDWQFFINESQCKAHASQGQKKSFLISLKLSQIELLSQSDIKPILLLDDIFEKLDPQRLKNLFQLLSTQNFAQIFMTHTNAEEIKNYTKAIFGPIQVEEL